jgi:hypothetical protein
VTKRCLLFFIYGLAYEIHGISKKDIIKVALCSSLSYPMDFVDQSSDGAFQSLAILFSPPSPMDLLGAHPQ